MSTKEKELEAQVKEANRIIKITRDTIGKETTSQHYQLFSHADSYLNTYVPETKLKDMWENLKPVIPDVEQWTDIFISAQPLFNYCRKEALEKFKYMLVTESKMNHRTIGGFQVAMTEKLNKLKEQYK